MKNVDLFKTELMVPFTCNELFTIMSALATESFSEDYAGRRANSKEAWDIRLKVEKFVNSNVKF